METIIATIIFAFVLCADELVCGFTYKVADVEGTEGTEGAEESPSRLNTCISVGCQRIPT
jgi:hypothetical protein